MKIIKPEIVTLEDAIRDMIFLMHPERFILLEIDLTSCTSTSMVYKISNLK